MEPDNSSNVVKPRESATRSTNSSPRKPVITDDEGRDLLSSPREDPLHNQHHDSFREEKLRIVNCLAMMDGANVSGADILDAASAASQRFTPSAENSVGGGSEETRSTTENVARQNGSLARSNAKGGDGGSTVAKGASAPGAVRVGGGAETERSYVPTAASSSRDLKQQQLQAATQVLQDRGTNVSGRSMRSYRASSQGSSLQHRSGRSLEPQNVSGIVSDSSLEETSPMPAAVAPHGVRRYASRDPQPSPITPITPEEQTSSTCGKFISQKRTTLILLLVVALLVVLVVIVVLIFARPNGLSSNDSKTVDDPVDDGYTTCADSEEIPDIWNQCQTSDRIQGIPSCQQSMYEGLIPSLAGYLPFELENDSCDVVNMALLSMAETTPLFGSEEAYTLPVLEERFALTCLYFSTQGNQWNSKSQWLSPKSHCTWHGVTCNDAHRVSAIDLSSNKLKGSLPSELAILANMKSLVMVTNKVEGTIPSELYHSFSNLETVLLEHNQITGISTEIGNWRSLTSFRFSFNPLGGVTVPTEVSLLPNLEEFECTNCQLEGTIPTETGKCTKLKSFGLGGNDLSGSLPTEISQLTDLVYFDVDTNLLESGTIPSDLYRLTKLSYLLLGGNSFEGPVLPADDVEVLTTLSNLIYLSISRNSLTGTLPAAELAVLAPSLETLDLGQNNLAGTIPTEIGLLTTLQDLQLGVNSMTGNLPSELGKLTLLTSLALRGNRGINFLDIPSEVEKLATKNGFSIFGF